MRARSGVWRRFRFHFALELLTIALLACTHTAKPSAQNPSPMSDTTRAHQRLEQHAIEGVQFTVELPSPGASRHPQRREPSPRLRGEGRVRGVDVLVTPRALAAHEAELVIHFHGAPWVPFQAALSLDRPLVVAAVNVGQGGGIYDRTFADPAVFDRLLDDVRSRSGVRINRLYLAGFSAGYGAIRAILRNRADVDGILLLDGLHTGYVPERKPLAEGGMLDTKPLEPLLDFAQASAGGRKRFIFTHSEIFPGTFASTTETADYLIRQLGLKRTPVVRWGPLGMQQLSEVHSGGLTILGFAGNSAPDHVDHFHAMPEFLKMLVQGDSP
jgi:hypothetical protein